MNDIRALRGGKHEQEGRTPVREMITPYLDALAATLTRVQNDIEDIDLLVRYNTRLTGSAVQAVRLATQLGDKGSTDALAKLETLLADAERLNPGSITGRRAGSTRKDVA
jgi:citrate synthase